jgi:hypothetical protein
MIKMFKCSKTSFSIATLTALTDHLPHYNGQTAGMNSQTAPKGSHSAPEPVIAVQLFLLPQGIKPPAEAGTHSPTPKGWKAELA